MESFPRLIDWVQTSADLIQTSVAAFQEYIPDTTSWLLFPFSVVHIL